LSTTAILQLPLQQFLAAQDVGKRLHLERSLQNVDDEQRLLVTSFYKNQTVKILSLYGSSRQQHDYYSRHGTAGGAMMATLLLQNSTFNYH
jgi:hypothetical protein